MNPDPENFEQLRKLLALKRHEQPPPGYFDNLPNQIWARIERESAAPAPSFWTDFLNRFVLRPTVAYGFAVVVCATLIVGIGTSLNREQEMVGNGSPNIVQQQKLNDLNTETPALAKEMENSTNASSTNPLVPTPSIQLKVQPVNFAQ